MRKVPALTLLSASVPALLMLPVVTPSAAAAPHPVASSVTSVPLRGVDAAALAAQGAASRTESVQARVGLPADEQGKAAGTPAVLTRELATAEFSALGATWTSPTDVDLTVVVRTRGESGWSTWSALEESGIDDVAAPTPGREGTDPSFVGTADAVQVRVDVRAGELPKDLRVELVDPGTSAADDAVGRAPAASGAAAVATPRVYSRAEWGADESRRGGSPSYMPTIRAAVVHHTADGNSYSSADVPRILRSIYAYHTQSRGWSDVGYNFIVDKFGRVWEGRAGGISRPVAGAHTGGFNYETFGISALGNYETAAAPRVMVDAISRVVAWKLSLHGRDPAGSVTLTSAGGGTSKYGAGQRVTLPVIFAHRQVGATSCPGANLYSQMDRIREQVADLMAAPTPTPTPTAAALIDPKLGGAVTATYSSSPRAVTVTAGVAREQAWRLEVREPCGGRVVRTLTGTATASRPIAAVWDRRTATGAPVRPGRYTLTLSSEQASPFTGTAEVTTAAAAPEVAATPLPGKGEYVPVTPARILDTRGGSALPPGTSGRVDVKVLGVGGVPSRNVTAVALNVTAVCSAADNFLTVWPAGSRQPESSSLNVGPGAARAALVTSAVGGDGKVSIGSRVLGNVVVDVVGYWTLPTSGHGYTAFTPTRVYDSRTDKRGAFADGETRTFTLPTLGGIPARHMTSATLNVTVTEPTGAGYVAVLPAATGTPTTSSLNFTAGETAANRVVTAVRGGTFVLHNVSPSAHVVIDAVGVTSGTVGAAAFTPVAPQRVLDTRTGSGPVSADDPAMVRVAGVGGVPFNARAVIYTLTAVRPSGAGSVHVTAWPAGTPRPGTSDLNLLEGDVRANLVVGKVGSRGYVEIAPGSGRTDLVVDVLGYYL